MTRTILIAILLAATSWSQSFEAASIRPRADEHIVSLKVDGGHFIAKNVNLSGLIGWTWNLKSYQLIGGPKWAVDERYDVDAKAPDGIDLTQEIARKMMESLLAERFLLKVRHETREFPVYNLIVLKNGPKFHESAPDASYTMSMAGPRAGNHMKVTAGTMAQLATQLALDQTVGRPVIDKTGLTGRYDYAIAIADGISTDDPEFQPTFAALPDQLGLKLEPSKANIEVLIVESADHPSLN